MYKIKRVRENNRMEELVYKRKPTLVHYIIREYIEYCFTDYLLDQRMQLTLESTIHIGIQLTNILEDVHSTKAVYSDIQTSNIAIGRRKLIILGQDLPN